jgi:hypothetical protein
MNAALLATSYERSKYGSLCGKRRASSSRVFSVYAQRNVRRSWSVTRNGQMWHSLWRSTR